MAIFNSYVSLPEGTLGNNSANVGTIRAIRKPRRLMGKSGWIHGFHGFGGECALLMNGSHVGNLTVYRGLKKTLKTGGDISWQLRQLRWLVCSSKVRFYVAFILMGGFLSHGRSKRRRWWSSWRMSRRARRREGRGQQNQSPYTVYMYWLVVWNMFYFSIYWE